MACWPMGYVTKVTAARRPESRGGTSFYFPRGNCPFAVFCCLFGWIVFQYAQLREWSVASKAWKDEHNYFWSTWFSYLYHTKVRNYTHSLLLPLYQLPLSAFPK